MNIFMSSADTNKLTVGSAVNCGKYGKGTVTLIDTKVVDGEDVKVFHVALENGETRHFTAEQLK